MAALNVRDLKFSDKPNPDKLGLFLLAVVDWMNKRDAEISAVTNVEVIASDIEVADVEIMEAS